MPIRSCRDKRTSNFLTGGRVKEFAADGKALDRAIAKLQAAKRLIELTSPPGNRLEALKGDRKGQYSIRANDRWRVCFRWALKGVQGGTDDKVVDFMLLEGEPYDVEIVDYH